MLDPPLSRHSIFAVPLPTPNVTAEPPGTGVRELSTIAEACDVQTESVRRAVAIAETVIVEVP